jgi:DNA modification methylase
LKDFRGKTIQAYIDAGWIHHGEVVIDKDPQAQAIRTKAKSLLFVQVHKDSSWSRPALSDIILLFRKPGENQTPIIPDINNEEWIEWARPIWYGIKESDTLQYTTAREEKDERHICPLQLGTIERCIRLWSNPGETVFSPFMGIGSEGYTALKLNRRFVGIELKEAYWRVAARNLKQAEDDKKALMLFDIDAISAEA